MADSRSWANDRGMTPHAAAFCCWVVPRRRRECGQEPKSSKSGQNRVTPFSVVFSSLGRDQTEIWQTASSISHSQFGADQWRVGVGATPIFQDRPILKFLTSHAWHDPPIELKFRTKCFIFHDKFYLDWYTGVGTESPRIYGVDICPFE